MKKTCFVNFLPTAVGECTKKHVDIVLSSALNKIIYNNEKQDIDKNIFNVEYSMKYNNAIHLTCSFKYTPVNPNEKNIDYIRFLEEDGEVYVVVTTGESYGPSVTSTVKQIVFNCNGKHNEISKTFELNNSSSMEAVFQFDIDSKEFLFSVTPLNGVIPSKKHCYVTVKYNKRKYGIFASKLYCLIKYHKPIIIELIAMNKLDKCQDYLLQDVKPNLTKYQMPFQEIVGFKGYMIDSTEMESWKPYCLNKTCIDFGYTNINTDVKTTCTFSLLNNTKEQIKVVWEEDIQNTFKIEPLNAWILPKENGLFQCYFQPQKVNMLYGCQLNGYIYWISNINDQIEVPIPLCMRFLGHTFIPSLCWLPQAEITPKIVIMPPCMPGTHSYTTAMLKRSGYLPISFKLIPPSKTYYTIKPMQGLLTGNYQIFIIDLNPQENECKYYECWKVELNGQPNYALKLNLKGYSQFPRVELGENNIVNFPSVHYNCEKSFYVPICNKSRYAVRYKFTTKINEKSDRLRLNNSQGLLNAYEQLMVVWTWISGCGVSSEPVLVDMEIQALENRIKDVGVPIISQIVVIGKATMAKVTGNNEKYHFGNCQISIPKTVEFQLCNSGCCDINFKLYYIRTPLQMEEVQEEIMIVPAFGVLKCFENLNIKVIIVPRNKGLHEFVIKFNVRKTEEDKQVVTPYENPVFTFNYFAIMPTLQITDIQLKNTGPLFSKVCIWKLLEIDNFNKILRTMKPDSTTNISLYFPECMTDTETITIICWFSNTACFQTGWSISCEECNNAPPIIQKVYLPKVRRKCNHTNSVKISPHKEFIEEESMKKIVFSINYVKSGLVNTQYLLELSDNRKINMLCCVKSITNEPSAYIIDYECKFHDICIGDQKPCVQIFWLYNNSSLVTNYQVNMNQMIDGNKYTGTNVLRCLNPTDAIEPFKPHPILFLFRPIEVKQYQMEIPLSLESNSCNLQISGQGSLNYNTCVTNFIKTTACKLPEEDVITLSTYDIIIESFYINNTAHKLFLMKNNSHTDDYEYKWRRCSVKNIVDIMVVNDTGILHPDEQKYIHLKLNSLNTPCIVQTARLFCTILNITKQKMYEETKLKYEKEAKELSEQFIITEKGITYPKPKTKISNQPKEECLVLSVSCVIESVYDVDFKSPIERQLKQSPIQILPINKNKSIYEKNIYLCKILKTTMNIFINSVLYSEIFKMKLQKIQKQPIPYYTQIRGSKKEITAHNKACSIEPSANVIAEIIKKSIAERLQADFFTIKMRFEYFSSNTDL